MRKGFWKLLAFVFITLMAGSAAAQDTPLTVYCTGLSDADCALLTDSAAVMRSVTSAAIEMDIRASLSGLPDVPGVLSVRISGNGSYAITDPAGLGILSDPDVIALASTDPAAYFQQLASALKAFSGDLSFTLFFSPEIRSLVGVSFFAIDTPLPDKIGFSARMVEGIGYLNLSKLAGLDRSGELPQGWVGMDLAAALNAALAQMPPLSSTPTGTELSTTDQIALMQRYARTERLADTTVDGQSAAVFHLSLDMVGLLADPGFRGLMEQQLAAQGQTLSKNEFEQVMQMVRLLVQDLHVDSTQAVALESKQVLQSSFTFHWPLDLGAFMSSVTGSNEPTDRLDVLIEAQTHFSQYDAVALIEAPADAQIVPLTEIK
jgi:hypothetical protein